MNTSAEMNTDKVEKYGRKTCKYKGATYFVLNDISTGRCFIEVDGNRKYLDKNGCVANRQKGSDNVTTAIENFEDMRKIQDYFIQNEEWNFYLLFTLNANTGRRISDLLESKWSDFFCENGSIRQYWKIMKIDKDTGERVSGEKKTSKKKDIFINSAVREAFDTFFAHEKIDFKYDYDTHVFTQLHGNYKGRVLSAESYRQHLMKAGEACLDYEIRSHSMRRGMGQAMLELHPNDPQSKAVLMEIYNHSSEKMTNKYLGSMRSLEKEYFEDFGEKYQKYVMHGEEIPFVVKKPVSVYDNSELRKYMMVAFAKILDAKDETDHVALMELYNELLDGLEEIAR